MADGYVGKQKTADVEARRKASANFTLELPDITTDAMRKEPLVKHPASPDGLKALIASTPFRIGVSREGPRPKLRTIHQMRADHAATQDSLNYIVPPATIQRLGLIDVGETETEGVLETYLRFPPKGRKFSAAAKKVILEKCKKNPTVQIVVSNGLSGYAIERYAGDVLKGLVDGLKAAKIDVGAPVYVNRGRVGLLNDIGDILNAEVSVVLIGERPGLIIGDALSIYAGYKQRWEPLTTDANRDNICMISKLGKDPLEAAAEGVALIKDYLKYKTSGVALAEAKKG
ncbi:MAG: Ethanolamine ammonia-lyase light chain [Chloroflexi bacterium ADurb.Bin180]|nr:MAG: Ethanolamine ammonia-lyase light chain [Chloroflexi bacterium ADurb.Bin180]HNR95982.1 ethanolamine ammonia-lyase light chain EutC [Anaerolineae bacterium]